MSKIENIFELMSMLYNGQVLYAQDARIQKELNIDERTLRRYLDEIYINFKDIIFVDKKLSNKNGHKTTTYRVIDKKKDVSKTLRYFLEKDTDLSWVLTLMHEQDPALLTNFKEDTKQVITKVLHENNNIFLFKSQPFELLQNNHHKKIFTFAKRAVKNHEYANIEYYYDKKESLQNIKCLKLIYMHFNWYLAIEDKQNQFRFLRLVFIQSIGYAKISTFQPNKVAHYNQFFKEFQNAFSLPQKKQKIAYIRISNKISKYFDKDMKSFFNSQKILSKNNDGTIDLSIKYSQALEILPFIKKWLPNITILRPQSLQEELIQDLQNALKDYMK